MCHSKLLLVANERTIDAAINSTIAAATHRPG